MAATNKCLARSNKSRTRADATSKGMTINGVTYGLIYLSAIPLLFILWRVGKASIGIQGLVFLGMIGMIFLIQWVDALIGPNTIMALIYIMAGVR